MIKINEDVFNSVSESASLKESKENHTETQRYVMVYDVPKEWIKAIKKRSLKSSQYFKQAVLEKLERDGML